MQGGCRVGGGSGWLDLQGILLAWGHVSRLLAWRIQARKRSANGPAGPRLGVMLGAGLAPWLGGACMRLQAWPQWGPGGTSLAFQASHSAAPICKCQPMGRRQRGHGLLVCCRLRRMPASAAALALRPGSAPKLQLQAGLPVMQHCYICVT